MSHKTLNKVSTDRLLQKELLQNITEHEEPKVWGGEWKENISVPKFDVTIIMSDIGIQLVIKWESTKI